MATYIFVTKEGYTYQPNSEAIEPDSENLQVLGFAMGAGEEEAFENLIAENLFLLDTTFNEVECLELRHDFYQEHLRAFSLVNAKPNMP